MVNAPSNTSEDARFEKMLSETISVYNLTEKSAQCSKGKKKRWADLALLWRANANSPGYDEVFLPALHKICWGFYPDGTDIEKMGCLLSLVEEELLRDGPAFNMWKSNHDYRISFSDVSCLHKALKHRGPRCHSHITRNYISCYMWFNVVYKRKDPPQIDVAYVSTNSIFSARKHGQIKFGCCGFEEVIQQLVPPSINWSRAQWADDRNIFRYLKKTYGIDYMQHPEAFDKLYIFLISKWFFNVTDCIKYILPITVMSYSLAQFIWPENTQEQIEDMFLKACSRAKAVKNRETRFERKTTFSYETIKKSWLYDQILQWLNNNELSAENEKKIRKAVFALNVT